MNLKSEPTKLNGFNFQIISEGGGGILDLVWGTYIHDRKDIVKTSLLTKKTTPC